MHARITDAICHFSNSQSLKQHLCNFIPAAPVEQALFSPLRLPSLAAMLCFMSFASVYHEDLAQRGSFLIQATYFISAEDTSSCSSLGVGPTFTGRRYCRLLVLV